MRSVCPSVVGWKAVESLSLMPSVAMSVFQNAEVKSLSLSLMIDLGIPWYRMILSTKIFARD